MIKEIFYYNLSIGSFACQTWMLMIKLFNLISFLLHEKDENTFWLSNLYILSILYNSLLEKTTVRVASVRSDLFVETDFVNTSSVFVEMSAEK